MHTLADDYDLVLELDAEASLEVAKQYLEDAGIPALIDQDLSGLAQLGYSTSSGRGRLFVPKGMRARAEEVLTNLRGQGDTLERLVQAGSVPGKQQPQPPRRWPAEPSALVIVIALVTLSILGWILWKPD